MFRFLTLLFVSATFASAFVLYSVNYKTRALEHELREAGRVLEERAREVATLRAEREFLARPARLAREAEKLGMAPANGAQFILEEAATSAASDRGARLPNTAQRRGARSGDGTDVAR